MNVFKQLIASLYSPPVIAETRNQGIGKTILYVFLLTLISIIPSAWYFSALTLEAADTAKVIIAEDLPDFKVNSSGTLTADTDKPFTAEENGFTFIVDPTGEMTKEDVELESDNGFALLKNEFVIVAEGRVQENSYNMLKDMELSRADLNDLLQSSDSILAIAIPLMILGIYLFSSAGVFIKITFFAVFGLLFKNALRRQLSYRHLWRMTAYSITLPTIFFTIMAAFQAAVPFSSFINWFVTFIMLYLALKEVPQDDVPVK